MSLGALSACGGSKVHHLTDGGTDAAREIDARETDARDIDASTQGAVTIVVTLDGSAAPGATVYFQNADSSLVAEATTGSDGTATQVMKAGGFVTLIEPQAVTVVTPPPDVSSPITPNGQQVDTFADVEPGDVLHVDIGSVAETGATIQLTVPADGSAAEYSLTTTCGNAFFEATAVGSGSGLGSGADVGSGSGSAAVQQATVTLDSCDGVADMLLVSEDVDGNPLNELYAPSVPVTDGSAVTLTQSYTPMTNLVLVGINVPATVQSNGAFGGLFSPHGFLDFNDINEGGEGNVEVFDYILPPAPLVSLEEEEFDGSGSAVLDDQVIGDWGSAAGGTTVFDATADRLPDYTAAPTFDIPSEQIQFGVTGGSASVDGIITSVAFTRTTLGPDDETITATWDWRIVAPGSEVGAVAFPTLPTDEFAWNGSDGDQTSVDGVELGHVTGGYDAARPVVFSLDFDFDSLAETTPSGHVVEDYFDLHQVDVAPAVKRPARRGHGHGRGPARAKAWRAKR
jgi:hypothetical protein